jgi:large subunit ribosomal protein L31
MKQDIHPDYKLSTVHCACGESFETRSTKQNVRLDICSVCHPFFTGKQKLIDTEGRVDKFIKKYKKA